MISKNRKTQRLISFLIIIIMLFPSLLLFSIPQKAEATAPVWDYLNGILLGLVEGSSVTTAGSTTINTGISIKNLSQEIIRQILMAVAKKALQEITKSTVNWINSGFHGSPLFLENSGSFFEDIVKSEIKTMVDTFGYDSVRFPYGKDFAISTINTYKRTLENNLAYSLSNVMSDPVQLNNYRHNFDVGGWNAFLVNTQYPQNNYLGFRMMLEEELARKISSSPGVNNAITKVKETLQQGQGFLSPQICTTNPAYNNMVNEFQKPSFKPSVKFNEEACFFNDDNNPTTEEQERCDTENINYTNGVAIEKQNFNEKNTCPGGLVATTPGGVVSNQITTALNIPANSTLQAMGLGNSLSAIFDALLNKFLNPDSGLLGLASNKNSTPPADDWSYNELTLGSPEEDGTNSTWDSGPDEEIILDTFKKQLHGKTIVTTVKADGTKETIEEIGNTNTAEITRGTYIPGDIANVETEIILMNEMPKLINNLDRTNPGIMQLTEVLDQCIPGPDKSWESRLKEEQERVSRALQKDQGSDDSLKVKASNETIRELKFAIDSFKEWVNDRMSRELPNSILYIDAVNSIDNFYQQLKEVTGTKRTKSQALARLKAIAGDEKAIIKTGLAAIRVQPEPGSTEERTMVALKKQYNSVQYSISNSFTIEDTRSQLDALKDKKNNTLAMITECKTARVAAGWEEVGKDKSKQNNGVTEIEKFCSIPIVSGFSHGIVVRNDKAARLTNCPANPGGCGRVRDGISTFDTTGWYSFRNPNIDRSIPTGDGTFEPQPADMGNPGFEDVAMVNAKNVYGDDDKINVEVDCNLIFRANKTNYTQAGENTF